MKPDIVLFVMDQEASFDQVQAFKQSFADGVIIITNINGNSKVVVLSPLKHYQVLFPFSSINVIETFYFLVLRQQSAP